MSDSFNASLQFLGREPISVSILNIVTDLILSGELKPGDRLPTENDFARRLGVGRNSVREAIKMLSSLGVIEVKRGSGTFISKSLSPAILNPLIIGLVFEQGSSMELIELRILIETGAAELAIEKADEADVELLDKANRALKEAAENNVRDSHVLRDLDLQVHYTLFEITKNPLVIKLAKAIYRLFYASIEKTVEIDPMDAYKNHQLYIDAIKKRDKLLVRRKINEALSFWKSYVQ